MQETLLFLISLIFIANVNSHHRSCVQCTSNEDGDCAKGLRLVEFTKECPKLNSGALVGKEAIGCRKIVHSRLEQVEDSQCSGRYCPQLFTVVRECAYVGKDQHDKRTRINSGKRFTYYQCSNEEDEFGMPCNRASGMPLIFSVISVAVIRLLF